MLLRIALAVVATLLLASHSNAQVTNPVHVLSAESASANTGDLVSISVLLDTSGGNAINGWSFGLCHDSTELILENAVEGLTTLTANNGMLPDVNSIDIFEGGCAVAVVICFSGCLQLPPATGYEILDAEYTCAAFAPTIASLDFCDTIGDPPVALVIAEGGATIVPDSTPGEISAVGPAAREFRFAATSSSAIYDPASGATATSTVLSILEEAASPGAPNAVRGFTMKLEHNPIFVNAVDVTPSAAMSALNGGSGPELFLPTVTADYISVEVLTSNSSPIQYLDATVAIDIADVSYQSNAANLLFNPFGIDTDLSWTPPLNALQRDNSVDVPAELSDVSFDGATISLVARSMFIRGDVNDNGNVDIADVSALLAFLFTGSTIGCDDAVDTNGSGDINLADAVTLLSYLFASGPLLPSPFPDCGFNGLASQCAVFDSCP